MTTVEEAPQIQTQGVSFLRHSGWVGPEDLKDTICIIGCGAVGSHIAQLAANMGFHKFQLWDGDIVEAHNLSNQAFDLEHVGEKKVEALAKVLKRFNPAIEVETHSYFESDKHKEFLTGPLVIATDTMSARYDIFKAFKFNPAVQGVYEVRLGFDFGEVHTVDNMNLSDCKNWYATLQDDSEIPEGPCNLRICTTLVWLASSIAVQNMCSKYAASRQQRPWKYDNRLMLSLTDQLRIQSVN